MFSSNGVPCSCCSYCFFGVDPFALQADRKNITRGEKIKWNAFFPWVLFSNKIHVEARLSPVWMVQVSLGTEPDREP
jgi:hypothetical protein